MRDQLIKSMQKESDPMLLSAAGKYIGLKSQWLRKRWTTEEPLRPDRKRLHVTRGPTNKYIYVSKEEIVRFMASVGLI